MSSRRPALSFRAVNAPGSRGYAPDLQRHHVLPRQMLDTVGLTSLIDAIGAASIGFHDFRRNGLLLPASEFEALRLGLPLHRALRRRLLDPVNWRGKRLHARDPALDFSHLDRMADALWAETAVIEAGSLNPCRQDRACAPSRG